MWLLLRFFCCVITDQDEALPVTDSLVCEEDCSNLTRAQGTRQDKKKNCCLAKTMPSYLLSVSTLCSTLSHSPPSMTGLRKDLLVLDAPLMNFCFFFLHCRASARHGRSTTGILSRIEIKFPWKQETNKTHKQNTNNLKPTHNPKHQAKESCQGNLQTK